MARADQRQTQPAHENNKDNQVERLSCPVSWQDDAFFEALGATDELNSHIGVAREFCMANEAVANTGLAEQLLLIQSGLMDVGSAVATPLNESSEWKLERTKWDDERPELLE